MTPELQQQIAEEAFHALEDESIDCKIKAITPKVRTAVVTTTNQMRGASRLRSGNVAGAGELVEDNRYSLGCESYLLNVHALKAQEVCNFFFSLSLSKFCRFFSVEASTSTENLPP